MARCSCACCELPLTPSSSDEEIRGRKDRRDANKAKHPLQVVGNKCERAQRRTPLKSNSSDSVLSLDTYREFLTSQLHRLEAFSGYAAERMSMLSHTGQSACVPLSNTSSYDSRIQPQYERRHSKSLSQSISPRGANFLSQ
jgi:hypothetical protein